jgi:hypothetical protein
MIGFEKSFRERAEGVLTMFAAQGCLGDLS